MDPLALLSNLHGDGPATLHRLRRYGCDTLTGLLGASTGDLAPVLGWEDVRTERFLREAEVLARRLGEGVLDSDDETPPAFQLHMEAEAAMPEPRREEPESDRGRTGEHKVRASEEIEDPPVKERNVRDEVLVRWRELDETEPVSSPAVLVPHTPSTPVAPPGTPLTEVAIDGLDAIRRKALLTVGIATLEELAAADDLDLHQQTGLPFTIASRITFLARRLENQAETAAASPPEVAVDSGSRAYRDGPAGPFA